MKVNNVVWIIDGSDSPLHQALADAIDRPRLQALVGKPLPTVEESQALAAQAVPATVAEVPAASPATQAMDPPDSSASAVQVAPSATGSIDGAVDTGNKLRGLFGR